VQLFEIRLRYLSQLFHLVRLDHANGFFHYGSLDPKDKKNDKMLKGPGFVVFKSIVERCRHMDLALFAEISSNMARYDGIRYGLSIPDENVIKGYFTSRSEGFGEEVRRRILLGTYVLSSGYYDAYYNKANLVREMLREEFAAIFENVDAVAMPTSPIPAFNIGEKSHDPLAMYLADIFTVPVNIVGVPAISIPSGTTSAKLPLSLQLLAPHFREDILFTIGKDFEKLY
jgi:aspartyl-tRNA(Asn)/glutamyl-tRNA(Gln) amidotransferase subunit A